MGADKGGKIVSENYQYWIWLQQSIGYANQKVNTVRKFYPSIVDFYNAGRREWELCGCFTRKELERLYENTLDETEEIIDRCELLGYNILTLDSKDYPAQLKEIYDPPAVLYVNGELPDMENTLSIGVVGTRNATLSGKKLAYSISYDLAKAGVNIISGGALGIDSSSHKGALNANGKTVCVLGCGLSYNYLMSNADLRARIAESGAVISEYPPNMPPYKNSFPKRNRIISALSQGILVIEAGERSGALITANTAIYQNKDIFAVPGDPSNPVAEGTNSLIKQGARAVTNAYEILEEYLGKYSLTTEENYIPTVADDKDVEDIISGKSRKSRSKFSDSCYSDKPVYSDKKSVSESSSAIFSEKSDTNKNTVKVSVENEDKQSIVKKVSASLLSDEANLVYDAICENVSVIDNIVYKTGLPISKVMQSITELEIYGAIEATREGKYIPV